jgi:arylsulfatase A-like enzyme
MKSRHSAVLLILIFGYLSFSNALALPPPNILWITIEDTSPIFIGAYGNNNAHTPNIDQLAREGVRFTNAFSTGTVCAPSRSTIITGVRTYELGTGHHRSEYLIPNDIKGFPYFLRQAGYYTSNNPKTDYNVGDPQSFIQEAWDASSSTADWRGRAPGQPFFSVFNFNESHQSRTMTWPYTKYESTVLFKLAPDEIIGDLDFPMPPFYRDSLDMRKQFARVYNSLSLTDKLVGQLLDQLQEENLLEQTIIFFFADHGEGIPRGKTNGINLGYRVPFVIWFPAMYASWSPWGPGQVVSDELIDFEDLAPTILSLANAERPPYLKGRVLIGDNRSQPNPLVFLSNDRSDDGIDLVRSATDGRYMYSRNYMPFMPELRYINYAEISEIKQLMRDDYANGRLNELQSRGFKDRPAEFLFDLQSDPWETRNLASDPLHLTALKKMRNAVKKNLVRSRDVMLLPEYELGLIQQLMPPYTFRLDNTLYPIDRIVQAVDLSGKLGRSQAQQQISLLTDQNKIVRYWAATGLRSQSRAILLDYKTQLTSAIADDYPPVAIMAAATLYHFFGLNSAKNALIRFARSDNADLALLTINSLLYTSRPEPFIPVVQEVSLKWLTTDKVGYACQDFLSKTGVAM